MTDDDWNDAFTSISSSMRNKLLALEKRAYEATRADLSENERRELARYVVTLGLISDIQHSRPEFIQRHAAEGLLGALLGLSQRQLAYRGAASSLEQRWVPEDARRSHNRMIRSLRDFAAIDRRSAAELRSRKSTNHYSTGEEETRNALRAMNESAAEIVGILRGFFSDGSFDRHFIRELAR